MAKLQISKTVSSIRITDLETGAYEELPVAQRADKPAEPKAEPTIIVTDEPELSGRLHFRS